MNTSRSRPNNRPLMIAISFFTGVMLSVLPGSVYAQVSPLFRSVELNVGDEATVTLSNSRTCVVKLNGVRPRRDPVMGAIRSVEVDVTVDGSQITLTSGLYRLPKKTGDVQIDCPVTRDYQHDSHIDHWAVRKDVRLRLWPGASKWIQPGSFAYPVGQKWFASQTWFSNEAVSARPDGKFYYHSGMDIGGSEGQVPVLAATDGKVVSVANHSVEGLPKTAVQPRYDVIYIRDKRGWLYRYSHLDSIRTRVRLGAEVVAGQPIGTIGKEGASGGWSHLHFEIKSIQPSGEWGTEDSYAFLWQVYLEQFKPKVVAIARPRYLTAPGERIVLDGSRSWASSKIAKFEWKCSDGTSASGPTIERTYTRQGTYNEILTVTDDNGNKDVDFAIVKVVAGNNPSVVPGMHATYFPTTNLRPGTPITFKVRARASTAGIDVWDFGDGSKAVEVKSNVDGSSHAAIGYATTVHRYKNPGRYIVNVRRESSTGTAVDHLDVVIGE